jgi:hypothetical protein
MSVALAATSEFSAAAAAAALPEPAASIEMLDMTVEAPLVTFTTTMGVASTMPPPPVSHPPTGPLIHRLMENVEPPKELDRVYDRDYLALRYRAFLGGKEGSDPWKGATALEKQLIACVDEDGALRRENIIHFLGHITECSENWALPLAILERSLKEDEEDFKRAAAADEKEAGRMSVKKTKRQAKQGKRKRDEDEDSDYSGREDEDEEWQGRGEPEDGVDMDSSSSLQAVSVGGGRTQNQSFETKTVAAMSPQFVKVKKPPVKTPRMELFVKLGGLRILTIWLSETKLPEFGTKTGSLMLPLLTLISKLPFNRQAIERSRINKAILATKRGIKTVMASADKPADAAATTVKNPLYEVLDVISNIKRLWEEKCALKEPPAMANALSDFKDKMMSHIAKIQEEEMEKAAQLVIEDETTTKSGLSLKERAKTQQKDEWSNIALQYVYG